MQIDFSILTLFSSLNPHFQLLWVRGKDGAFQKAFGMTELRAICLAVGYSPWTQQGTRL
jgi:hypothetical protein